MMLREACDELNRRGCGPCVGVSHEVCEDDANVLFYIDFQNDYTLTCMLPLTIREQSLDERRAAVWSTETWMVHSLGGAGENSE